MNLTPMCVQLRFPVHSRSKYSVHDTAEEVCNAHVDESDMTFDASNASVTMIMIL